MGYRSTEMNPIVKEADGKFVIPDGWAWRKQGEFIRRGDLIASFYLSDWEKTNADWWGKKVKELDLVIRRIR